MLNQEKTAAQFSKDDKSKKVTFIKLYTVLTLIQIKIMAKISQIDLLQAKYKDIMYPSK